MSRRLIYIRPYTSSSVENQCLALVVDIFTLLGLFGRHIREANFPAIFFFRLNTMYLIYFYYLLYDMVNINVL